MRIAHLILTHKNPGQLERLLDALEHPGFTFYIHIDKKADQQAFSYLSARKNVRFVRKRTRIYWAGYGTIQATINGFLDILPENYDYINVISGQDFPIKPAAYIYDYLCRSKGKEFMMHDAIDDPGWNVGPQQYL